MIRVSTRATGLDRIAGVGDENVAPFQAGANFGERVSAVSELDRPQLGPPVHHGKGRPSCIGPEERAGSRLQHILAPPKG
ncbi:MAG: hypothetical protein R2748_00500 [Bryobacterales bacterium]